MNDTIDLEVSKREQSAADEFINNHASEIRTELKVRTERKWSAHPDFLTEMIEELPDAVERELNFTRSVIEAFQRWNAELDVIVLWDIDDNLGRRDLETNKWMFRASWKPLMGFLRERYPKIVHGLLTDRKKVHDDLNNQDELGLINKMIDRRYIYSSNGEIVSDEKTEEIREKVLATSDEIAQPTYIQKAYKLEILKEQGLNVKLIDDNLGVKSFGKDGVCTESFISDL